MVNIPYMDPMGIHHSFLEVLPGTEFCKPALRFMRHARGLGYEGCKTSHIRRDWLWGENWTDTHNCDVGMQPAEVDNTVVCCLYHSSTNWQAGPDVPPRGRGPRTGPCNCLAPEFLNGWKKCEVLMTDVEEKHIPQLFLQLSKFHCRAASWSHFRPKPRQSWCFGHLVPAEFGFVS